MQHMVRSACIRFRGILARRVHPLLTMCMRYSLKNKIRSSVATDGVFLVQMCHFRTDRAKQCILLLFQVMLLIVDLVYTVESISDRVFSWWRRR